MSFWKPILVYVLCFVVFSVALILVKPVYGLLIVVAFGLAIAGITCLPKPRQRDQKIS